MGQLIIFIVVFIIIIAIVSKKYKNNDVVSANLYLDESSAEIYYSEDIYVTSYTIRHNKK